MYVIIIHPKEVNIHKDHADLYRVFDYDNFLLKVASNIIFIKSISGQKATHNERILIGLDHNLSIQTLELISNFSKRK